LVVEINPLGRLNPAPAFPAECCPGTPNHNWPQFSNARKTQVSNLTNLPITFYQNCKTKKKKKRINSYLGILLKASIVPSIPAISRLPACDWQVFFAGTKASFCRINTGFSNQVVAKSRCLPIPAHQPIRLPQKVYLEIVIQLM